MQAKRLAMNQAWGWLADGWRLFNQGRALWLAMAALYLAGAIVLDQIPFVGILIVVLLTPILAAGPLAYAAELGQGEASEPAWSRVGDTGDKLKRLFARALHQLFYGAAEPDRLLSLMVIATLLLGATVVVQILAELLKVGGSALPAFIAGSVGPSIWVPAMISLALVLLLKLILTFVMMYAVQLVIVDRHSPLTALEYGFNACIGSALPLLGISVALVLPLMVAAGVGDLVAAFVGLLVLPLLTTSLYRSYRDLYA